MPRNFHLNTFEGILAVIAAVLTVAIVYIEVCLSLPIGSSVIVAMVAALITLTTFLYNRHVLRRRLRVSISEELIQAIALLEASCDTLYCESGEADIRYTAFPDEILSAQIGELGSLSKSEVKALSEYYTRLQIFQDLLSTADGADSVKSHLNTTGSEKPEPCKLIETAITCVEELNVDKPPEVNMKKYPGYEQSENDN